MQPGGLAAACPGVRLAVTSSQVTNVGAEHAGKGKASTGSSAPSLQE